MSFLVIGSQRNIAAQEEQADIMEVICPTDYFDGKLYSFQVCAGDNHLSC